MNAIQKKFQGTSKVIAVITKILYISLIVAVCFELVGIIWHIISPEKGSFMLGRVKLISPLLLVENQGIATDLFIGVAGPLFFIAILIQTSRIFKDISHEYTPFLPKNIKRMKRIAILLLIDNVVSPHIDLAIRKSISLTAIKFSDFNAEIFVLAIIIYCFALIFQYGAELQQQSDETL